MDTIVLFGLLDLFLKLIFLSFPMIFLICLLMAFVFLFSIKALKFKEQRPSKIIIVTALFMVLFLVANAIAMLPVSSIVLENVQIDGAILETLSSQFLWQIGDVAGSLLPFTFVFYMLAVKFVYKEGWKNTIIACLISLMPWVLLFIKI
jgi:hypothetical protein